MPDRLQPGDIEQAAEHIGVEPAALQAVIQIEAAGSGFDAKGRPRVLFEPHYFYKLLPAGELRDAAVKAGLAHPEWRPGQYPNADGVWDQITRACEISEDAALQSCSWGLGQVMGINWSASGFNSVQELVQAMFQSEAAQLDLMVGFIVRNGLVEALKNRDWETFARRYNGPAYEQNGYHLKLAAAYDRAVA